MYNQVESNFTKDYFYILVKNFPQRFRKHLLMVKHPFANRTKLILVRSL